jgi:hypothetical protein
MVHDVTLYRLAAQCPRCGWSPSKRVTARHVELVRAVPPLEPLDWVKCQNRRCEHEYSVTARAYQQARAA